MKSYFDYIIQNQVTFATVKGNYQSNVFSKMMTKTMNHSHWILSTQLPFEITSRFLTAYNVQKK